MREKLIKNLIIQLEMAYRTLEIEYDPKMLKAQLKLALSMIEKIESKKEIKSETGQITIEDLLIKDEKKIEIEVKKGRKRNEKKSEETEQEQEKRES